ncbi:hypothetical protein SAMN04489740_1279 [Arthrobacter alpinus]|uniref:DUF1349 domain-containing protein n=1 Tax=Arthrobacter alpinus TaxID=656366 RepID=A0A1H5IDR5_9MICC|nr:DUF1349 domain-containing protein [Arthrobacter alpinus]SEE38339.1 hypothetical protein SAMN04489740_1279 [Arthrobacter alpinus]
MQPTISELPPLSWEPAPGHATYDESSRVLRLTAAPGVDWSNDSLGGASQHAASALGFIAPEAFSLSAKVGVETSRTTFDAGAISLWSSPQHWAKLCFEYSPQGQAMVVSVVTNGFSDDCNSSMVLERWSYLRVSRVGPGWAFHASQDGQQWWFVRLFRLDTDKSVHVGFLSQAPMGETCVATFEDITLTLTAPGDLRDGS